VKRRSRFACIVAGSLDRTSGAPAASAELQEDVDAMIDPAYVAAMARYNRWQNVSLYEAADTLSDAARRADRGAFFKSIHGTLNHVLWADVIWLSRIAEGSAPSCGIAASASYVDHWDALKRERAACDARLIQWAEGLDADALAGELTWRPASAVGDATVTKPRWLVIAHIFNHQTHHRGQAHALLTAAGAKPQATDLVVMQT
jgi:uncharacterized damage-inducible protein DinB